MDKSLFGVLVHAMDPFQAIRFRFHYGTIQECIYNLMTYGILHDTIPIIYNELAGGNGSTEKCGDDITQTASCAADQFEIDTEFHLAFLEALEEREEKDQLNGGVSNKSSNANKALEEESKSMAATMASTTMQQQQKQQQQNPQNQQQQQRTHVQAQVQVQVQQQQQSQVQVQRNSSGSNSHDNNNNNNNNNDDNNSSYPSETEHESESNNNNDTVVVILPGPLDIIMGRGCHNKNKPGNIRLKNLLETYYEQYNSTRSKNAKSALVQDIFHQVHNTGSRFLIQDKEKPGQWTIALYKKSHDKIAHDFRNMRRKALTTTTSTTAADTTI